MLLRGFMEISNVPGTCIERVHCDHEPLVFSLSSTGGEEATSRRLLQAFPYDVAALSQQHENDHPNHGRENRHRNAKARVIPKPNLHMLSRRFHHDDVGD
jgi:uncharacterized membrane protein YccC